MATPLPVDPEVKIPAAVRARAMQADELHKSMFAQPEGEPPPENPEPQGEQPQGEQPRADATPEPAPEPVREPPKGETDWERKFNGMEGRYKRQIQDLTTTIEGLQRAIQNLQSQPPAPEKTVTKNKLVTPEEEAEYGQDFLSVVGRRAKEEVNEEVESLKSTVAALQRQLSGVSGHIEMDSRQRMLNELDQKITDWRQINHDEAFLAWLKLPDVFSGAIRHDLLKAAFDRNDTGRVAAFFSGFLAEEAAVGSAGAQPHQTSTTPVTPEGTGKVPLERLAAPGRAKSAASASLPAEKPVFTSAQISQFYVDKQRGKYRGKEAEADRLEQQIIEAGREGRVR